MHTFDIPSERIETVTAQTSLNHKSLHTKLDSVLVGTWQKRNQPAPFYMAE
jgi:hypothetical protein